jgi:hypothetical protein
LAEAPRGSGTRGQLHDALTEGLDHLSDLVMAEAVYQRSIGAAERANAWLQVLSGDAIPERPELIRTQRPMQASEHRVSLLLPVGGTAKGTLDAAEPGLAAFADRIVPKFETMTVSASVRDALTGDLIETLKVPVPMLYETPLDLLLSDAARLKRRCLTWFDRHGGLSGRASAAIGDRDPGTDPGLATTLTISPDEASPEDWFAAFNTIQRTLRQARPLEPGDLAPIAVDPAGVDEALSVTLWNAAADELGRRADTVGTSVKKAHRQLQSRRRTMTELIADQYTTTGVAIGDNPAGDEQARAECRRLARTLWANRVLFQGDHLPLPRLEDWVGDLEGSEAQVLVLEEELKQRLAAANAHQRAAPKSPETLGDARGLANAHRRAIRTLLGRDAFPVFPVFDAVPQDTPELRGQRDIETGLEEWPKLRKSLSGIISLGARDQDWRLWQGVDRTAEAPPDPDDPRGEDEAPLLHHFGRLVAMAAQVTSPSQLCGMVVDEWTEQRPSTVQPATLTLNYDSPQAEAPNALLLCVAPQKQQGGWTVKQAADLVGELITWMQIRTMTAENTLLATTVLPGANLVGQKREDGEWINRIPTGRRFTATQANHNLPGQFQDARGGAVGLAASGLNEVSGSGAKRRGK